MVLLEARDDARAYPEEGRQEEGDDAELDGDRHGLADQLIDRLVLVPERGSEVATENIPHIPQVLGMEGLIHMVLLEDVLKHLLGQFFFTREGAARGDPQCERRDLNPQPLRDQILSLARLPIPPLSHSSIIRRRALFMHGGGPKASGL